jgi:hypothetical protein
LLATLPFCGADLCSQLCSHWGKYCAIVISELLWLRVITGGRPG